MKKELHPKKYPKTDEKETISVNILNCLLDINRIKADINSRDKIPNHDGHIELLDNDGYTIGKICIQVKGLNDKYLDPPKIQIDSSYFAYASLINLPFLLIGVDCNAKKAYWYHIKRNESQELGDQNSKVVKFHKENVIDGEDSKYIEEWEKIINEDMEKIKFYDVIVKEKKDLIDLLNKFKTSELDHKKPLYKYMHLFIDEINRLIEGHFEIIKKIMYNNCWKVGLIYFDLGNNKFGFALYPIDWNKNDVLIKKGDDEIWNALLQSNLRVVIFDQNDLIKDYPKNMAKKYIYDQLTNLIDSKFLYNQCNIVLSQEYVIAFINQFHKQMGIEKKTNYDMMELFSGFYLYLPLWIDETVKHLMIIKSEQFKDTSDLYFRKPYIDPSLLDGLIPYQDKKIIHSRIKQRILKKDLKFGVYTLGNRYISFNEFHNSLLYLKSNNLDNIDNIYRKSGYTGPARSHYIYEEYNKEDIEANVRFFFNNIFEVIQDLMITNFPSLSFEKIIFRRGNKIIIMYEILENTLSRGECPLDIEIIYIKIENESERIVEITPKNDEFLAIIKEKKRGDKFLWGSTEYTFKSQRSFVFTKLFEEIPLFNYSYQMIKEFFNDYFYDISEWYHDLEKRMKIGVDGVDTTTEITGFIEKNVYDAKNNINRLTIRSNIGICEVLVNGEKLGMIQIAQRVKLKGSKISIEGLETDAKIINYKR